MDYSFREDGKLHQYAVWYCHADGNKTWGYIETMFSFNPGERIPAFVGDMDIVIDFEL